MTNRRDIFAKALGLAGLAGLGPSRAGGSSVQSFEGVVTELLPMSLKSSGTILASLPGVLKFIPKDVQSNEFLSSVVVDPSGVF